MLIDWVTARIEFQHFSEAEWLNLRSLNDRIIRFKPSDSAPLDDFYMLLERDSIKWECGSWESVRSDTHQIAFRIGSDCLFIQGSPARCIGSGDAVFGEGASHALDIAGCVRRMAAYVGGALDRRLPLDPAFWQVSRVDVTGNVLLDSTADVRVALSVLRDCEGGRYRVSQQQGDTVYWSHNSKLRSGKAYAKGPHIRKTTKKPDYSGRIYTENELLIIDRLLRLELKLGSQFFRELKQRKAIKHWTEITPDFLKAEWMQFFSRMIGDSEMTNDNDLKQKIFDAAKTPGMGKSAYSLWLLIKSEGWQAAKENTSKTVWYRNLQILHHAGLGDADIAKGNVVQFRRKILQFQIIDSFKEAA
jgi:II/X family phage/plasmid replication protein